MEKIIRTVTDTLVEVNEIVSDGENALIKPLEPVLVKNTKVMWSSAMKYAQRAYPGKVLMISNIRHTSELYEMDITTFIQHATKKEM